MKEIVTTSANFIALIDAGKIIPQIEVGITVSEVQYGLDYQGVTKSRTCETLRFIISPEKLRLMAKGIVQFAEECEAEFDKAKGENP